MEVPVQAEKVDTSILQAGGNGRVSQACSECVAVFTSGEQCTELPWRRVQARAVCGVCREPSKGGATLKRRRNPQKRGRTLKRDDVTVGYVTCGLGEKILGSPPRKICGGYPPQEKFVGVPPHEKICWGTPSPHEKFW